MKNDLVSIEYAKYIADNLDKSYDYSEYIADNLDRTINFAEYLAENLYDKDKVRKDKNIIRKMKLEKIYGNDNN